MPKRCKNPAHPQVERLAAIGDRHVNALQGQGREVQPPFSHPLLPPVLESCVKVPQAQEWGRGVGQWLQHSIIDAKGRRCSDNAIEWEKRGRCRSGVRCISKDKWRAQGCQGRNLAPQSRGTVTDLAG